MGDRLRNRAPTLIKERGEDGLLGIDAIAETYWHRLDVGSQPAAVQGNVLRREKALDAVSASLGRTGPTGL